MYRWPALLETAVEKVTSAAAASLGAGLKTYLRDASSELATQQGQTKPGQRQQHKPSASSSSIGPSMHKLYPHSHRTAVAYAVFRGPGFFGSLSHAVSKSLPYLLASDSDDDTTTQAVFAPGGPRSLFQPVSSRKSVLVYGSLSGIAPFTVGHQLAAARPGVKNWLSVLTVVEPEAAPTQVGQAIFSEAHRLQHTNDNNNNNNNNSHSVADWEHLLRWRKFLPSEGPSSVSDEAAFTVSAYGLSKVGSAARRRELVKSMWLHTAPGGVLTLVEHGTPDGFAVIRDAREQLLAHSDLVSIVAPCPHHLTCPLDAAQTWCHFPVRIQRTRLMQLFEGKSPVNWYDEKLSYLVVKKRRAADQPAPSIHHELAADPDPDPDPDALPARVLAAPRKRSGHVVFDLCSHDGSLRQTTVAKSHAEKSGSPYKSFRKAKWGSLVAVPSISIERTPDVDNSAISTNIARRKLNLKRTRPSEKND